MCHFVLVFFSPFSIAITSLGEERANLSAFRTFVRFVVVWICRFPLPLRVWERLRFVIVALPGLFSYLFFVLAWSVVVFIYSVLRARRNEKEMKVKPATSFKLLTTFIHTKIRQDSKQKNVINSTFQVYVTKYLRNNPQEFIKQIL